MKRLQLTSAVLRGDEPAYFTDTPASEPERVALPASLNVPQRPHRRTIPGSTQGRMARKSDLIGRILELAHPTPTTCLPGTVLLLEKSETDPTLTTEASDLFLPTALRDQHVLAVGKTGSGKTTQFILPLIAADLADPKRSVIVIDAKGDLTARVLEMTRTLRGKKARFRYINFTDPKHSLAWNPAAEIKSRGEALDIAHCLLEAAGQSKSDSPFFRNAATRWIAAFLMGVQTKPEQANLGLLRLLFDLPPQSFLNEAKKLGLDELAAQLGYLVSENKNAETVQMEASNALLAWADDTVCATTSASEFRFKELISEPTVLVLRFPEGRERLLPLHTVFLQRLFDWVVTTADRHPEGRLPRAISLVVDEFGAAVGRVPGIESRINTFRSRRLSFTAAVQSLSQIEFVYGPAARPLLAGFSSLLLMPPVELNDAAYAADRTGMMQVWAAEGAGDGSGRLTREWLQERTVLSVADIVQPPASPERGMPASLLLPGMPPFQLYLPPIFRQPQWAHWERTEEELTTPPTRLPQRRHPLTQPSNEISVGEISATSGGLPPGITNTRGWTEDQIRQKLEAVKDKLDWANTTGSARKWFEAFENENKHRVALVLRLAEELQNRKATITEFFLAYVYSNTDNIQANLCYLDYTRLKKEEEKKRREAAAKAANPPAEVLPEEIEAVIVEPPKPTKIAKTRKSPKVAKGASPKEPLPILWRAPSPLGLPLEWCTAFLDATTHPVLGCFSTSPRSRVIASQNLDEDPTAVKVLLPFPVETADQRTERLRHEALAMVACYHPHVVRLDDFNSEGEFSYLTMEAFAGTLEQASQEKPPHWLFRDAFSQLLEGLAYIHSVGVLHRDIHPGNLLGRQSQNTCHWAVADFGQAQLPGDTASDVLSTAFPLFAAPEVRGGEAVPASDVYSLALSIAVSLLTTEGLALPPVGEGGGYETPDLKGLEAKLDSAFLETLRACLHPVVLERPMAKEARKSLQTVPSAESLSGFV